MAFSVVLNMPKMGVLNLDTLQQKKEPRTTQSICEGNSGTWIVSPNGNESCQFASDVQENRCGANARWSEKAAFNAPDGNGCRCEEGYKFSDNGCTAKESTNSCDPDFEQCDDVNAPPSRLQCRANYQNQSFKDYCLSQYKGRHFAAEAAAAKNRLTAECKSISETALSSCSDFSSLSSLGLPAMVSETSSKTAACQSRDQLLADIESINTKQNSCVEQIQSCLQSCSGLSENVYDEVVVLNEGTIQVCQTQSRPVLNKISSQSNAYNAPLQAAKTKCETSEPTTPQGQPAVNTASDGGSPPPVDSYSAYEPDSSTEKEKTSDNSELASSGSGFNDVLSGIGQFASQAASSIDLEGDGGFFDDSFQGGSAAFDNLDTAAIGSGYSGPSGRSDSRSDGSYSRKSSSLGFSNSVAGGDDMRGLADSLLSGGNTNDRPTANPLNANNGLNGQGQRGRGGSIGGTGVNPQAASLASNDPGSRRNPRRGGRRGSAQRNLVHGYKNVKPQDGGGALSIKPTDMKRYGKKRLKHECVKVQQCHVDVKASIFKNMNLQLRKSLHDLGVEI